MSTARIRLPRRGLMVRLVGSFLVLSVLMVSVVGVLAYVRARSTLQTSIYDRLDAAVEQKSGAINSWIDDQRRNVVFVGQLLDGQAHLCVRQRTAGGELSGNLFEHGGILSIRAGGSNRKCVTMKSWTGAKNKVTCPAPTLSQPGAVAHQDL